MTLHGRSRATGILLLLALLWSSPAFTQAPEVDVETRAAAIVAHLSAGDFEAVAATFDAKMKAALPVEMLRAGWDATVKSAGAFRTRLSSRTETKAAYRIVVQTCAFESATVDVQVVFDPAGAVAGLSLRPAATPASYLLPEYATPGMYVDEPVVAGSEGWPLPGTLTLPASTVPVPAVVLVHGSGPQDRNASFGPNRIFEDLATGLASRGIAVLRYEKRTKAHGARLDAAGVFTVKDEVVDDALAAVAFLKHHPRVDASRVFLLGHSLGGMLAPRIAVADPALAGVIVMAGAVRSLERSIVEQTRYLLLADGQFTDDERVQLTAVEQLAARVRSLTPSDAGRVELIEGAPASYWLDLRGYDPPALASRLTQPFLVLQGERDYQVTMADFGRWKAALDSRANVSFASYPSLNHLFLPGDGPSLPAEYSVPGHVDRAVIDDITSWIASIH